MIFDPKNYSELTCMHCDTEEKAKIFLEFLDSLGLTWQSGDSYLSKTNWGAYRSDTVYYFNRGLFTKLEKARGDVLNFDDFDWDFRPIEPEIKYEDIFPAEVSNG